VRVSAKAEYACVAMVELAAKHGDNQPVQIKTIADAHGISPRFLVQILLQLKGAGLVASSRGASGGYQLTRPPAGINLGEIIYTIDRNPVGHSALSALPPSLVVQTLHGVWQEVSNEEQRILERTTLAELVQRTRSSDVHSYQI
jgi:Rrf2 family protein